MDYFLLLSQHKGSVSPISDLVSTLIFSNINLTQTFHLATIVSKRTAWQVVFCIYFWLTIKKTFILETGITHQKGWFLNEVGQFSNHHVEIVFTKADDTVLDVFSALMILLGTR